MPITKKLTKKQKGFPKKLVFIDKNALPVALYVEGNYMMVELKNGEHHRLYNYITGEMYKHKKNPKPKFKSKEAICLLSGEKNG